MVWDLDTMKRLNDQASLKHTMQGWTSMRKAAELMRAIERGGFDLSPCMRCGELVVCIPDGLPMCEGCAGDEHAEQQI